MRPRHAFVALLATGLVAVAIPAAAGSSDTAPTSPDAGTITSQLTPNADTSASASPAASTSASASPSASTSAASDPATCIQSAGTNPLAILTCVTPAGGTNPLTGLISQLQGAAGGGGAGGLPVAPLQTLATCVQTNLTAVPPDGAKLETCFSSFAQSLTGAPQATCLDPLLQGAIGAVQDLVEKQNPAPLQAVLTGLPATLTTLASCLQGSSTITPTPTASTGTTTQSGGATTPTDPTEAVPVAATPNFTG